MHLAGASDGAPSNASGSCIKVGSDTSKSIPWVTGHRDSRRFVLGPSPLRAPDLRSVWFGSWSWNVRFCSLDGFSGCSSLLPCLRASQARPFLALQRVSGRAFGSSVCSSRESSTWGCRFGRLPESACASSPSHGQVARVLLRPDPIFWFEPATQKVSSTLPSSSFQTLSPQVVEPCWSLQLLLMSDQVVGAPKPLLSIVAAPILGVHGFGA